MRRKSRKAIRFDWASSRGVLSCQQLPSICFPRSSSPARCMKVNTQRAFWCTITTVNAMSSQAHPLSGPRDAPFVELCNWLSTFCFSTSSHLIEPTNNPHDHTKLETVELPVHTTSADLQLGILWHSSFAASYASSCPHLRCKIHGLREKATDLSG